MIAPNVGSFRLIVVTLLLPALFCSQRLDLLPQRGLMNDVPFSQDAVWLASLDREMEDQIAPLVEFLWPLIEYAKDNADANFEVILGMLSGDSTKFHAGLFKKGQLQAQMFMTAAEILGPLITTYVAQYRDARPEELGRLIGRAIFEIAAVLVPVAKAGQLGKISKLEVLTKLEGRAFFTSGPGKTFMDTVKATLKPKLAVTKMCFVAGTLVLARAGLMEIEKVTAGMEVWARDEFTGESGWRRVVQAFITHPAELFRLTYEVRGPPERSAGLQPMSRSAGFQPASSAALRRREGSADTPVRPAITETLGVTGPHPFWVSNRSQGRALAPQASLSSTAPQGAFLPAEELQPGDVLSLADGGTAVVTAKVLERAPTGQPFTTYNFEVEGYHTYFVGKAGVWVHNKGSLWCDELLSLYETLIQKHPGELPYKTLTRVRDELVGQPNAKGVLPKKLPGEVVGRASADVCQQMLDDYAGNLAQFPTVKMWREDFFSELQQGGLFKDVAQGGVDIHHAVEKYIQEYLGIPKALEDLCPGIPMPRNKAILDGINSGYDPANQLKAIHKGKDNGGISGILQSRIKTKGNTLTRQQIINELHSIYAIEYPQFNNLWPVTRDWLLDMQTKGHLSATITIP